MSVINKMLKELDQRQAPPPAGGPAVRPMRVGSGIAGKGREAFWRLLAFLLLVGVAWVVVIAFQLQVQPVVTNLAFRAAEDARSRRQPPDWVSAVPAVAAEAPASPLANPDLLRLAPSIQTPIPPERAPKSPVGLATVDTPAASRQPKAAEAPEVGRSPQAAKPLGAPLERQTNQGVEKRDRPRNPQEFAEADFRRGAGLLNEGRTGDAMELFSAALNADRNHESARQALAALLLDQHQIEPARRLLQDGLAINPGNAVFASSLARILIEGKDYEGALKALQGASAAGASSAEYRAMTGAVYQRLANHRAAMEAYQAALRLSPGAGSSWVGLAISLEALDHPLEAVEAYRRALATGTLTADMRGFTETRLQGK
jgi:MSHA biogenesis protein MshN